MPLNLASVVLAGGAGKRLGGRKLSALVAGRPLLEYALDTAAAAAEDIVVVVGRCPEVADLASAWAIAKRRTVRLATAADQSEGMGASLRAGLEDLAPGVDGVFVFLGDMPFVPVGILPLLAAALAQGAPAAAPAFGGLRGHPVLLGRSLIARRSLVAGDRGASGLLSCEPGLVLIEADNDGVLFDVDTLDDLAKAIARQGSGRSGATIAGDARPPRHAEGHQKAS